MVWSKNNPAPGIIAKKLDDDVRQNNAGIEDAVDKEHYFATGGNQSGRHRFGYGTEATRDGEAELLFDGAVWFLTGGDIPAGDAELTIRDQGGLQWLKASGRALLDMASTWTKAQTGNYIELTPSANVTSDWAAGNAFRFTANQDFILANPSNTPAAGKWGTWIYEITQDGATPRVMTLGTNYRTSLGSTLILSVGAGKVDYVVCWLRGDGLIHATLELDSRG